MCVCVCVCVCVCECVSVCDVSVYVYAMQNIVEYDIQKCYVVHDGELMVYVIFCH